MQIINCFFNSLEKWIFLKEPTTETSIDGNDSRNICQPKFPPSMRMEVDLNGISWDPSELKKKSMLLNLRPLDLSKTSYKLNVVVMI